MMDLDELMDWQQRELAAKWVKEHSLLEAIERMDADAKEDVTWIFVGVIEGSIDAAEAWDAVGNHVFEAIKGDLLHDDEICPRCNGSGEGAYDGSTCRLCHGEGVCHE